MPNMYIPALTDDRGFIHPPIECECRNCFYKLYIIGEEDSGWLWCSNGDRMVAENDVCSFYELCTGAIDSDIADQVWEYIGKHYLDSIEFWIDEDSLVHLNECGEE